MPEMKKLALVGARSAVGEEILRRLEETAFPVASLRLFSEKEEEESFIDFNDDSLLVETFDSAALQGCDIVFFCAGSRFSREFAPAVAATGALVIDTSAAWRDDAGIPLVAAGVNPLDLASCRARGIVAVPNAAAAILATVLKPLAATGLRSIVVTTCHPVASTGLQAIEALRHECGELLNGRPVNPTIYPHQIAFNALPQVGDFVDGISSEEARISGETPRLLALPALAVSATALRVPLFYGLGLSLHLETEQPLLADEARRHLGTLAGCEIHDDPAAGDYPQPLDAAGSDIIRIGRIRNPQNVATRLDLFIAADNLAVQAANAVRLAELAASAGL